MAHDLVELDDIPVRRLEAIPGTALLASLGLVGLGAAAFIAALLTDADRAWRAYQSNWLFFMGIAHGAVMLAAVVTMARGIWATPVRRISLSFVAFTPIGFLLMIPLLFAGEQIFPWVEHPELLIVGEASKEVYLNIPFLAARNLVLLAALVIVQLIFAYWALRPDAGRLRADAPPRLRSLYERLSRDWRGIDEEKERAYAKMRTIGPIMALVYAVALTIVVVDFVMSLEPHFKSTLLGGYFFMASFLGGIAATTVVTLIYRRTLGLDQVVHPKTLHDLGKMLFAFCVFWAYLFWAQYIVIWYGLLPPEQEFIVHRLSDPFDVLPIIILLSIFVLPFASLLGVAPKRKPAILGAAAGVVLFGLWLERYLLVFPSHYAGADFLPLGWQEVGIGLGFAGLMVGSLLFFASRFPIVQLWFPDYELALLEPGAEP